MVKCPICSKEVFNEFMLVPVNYGKEGRVNVCMDCSAENAAIHKMFADRRDAELEKLAKKKA